jgi:hypothetical protein
MNHSHDPIGRPLERQWARPLKLKILEYTRKDSEVARCAYLQEVIEKYGVSENPEALTDKTDKTSKKPEALTDKTDKTSSVSHGSEWSELLENK